MKNLISPSVLARLERDARSQIIRFTQSPNGIGRIRCYLCVVCTAKKALHSERTFEVWNEVQKLKAAYKCGFCGTKYLRNEAGFYVMQTQKQKQITAQQLCEPLF